MKLFSHKKTEAPIKKKRFNPHVVWAAFCVVFISLTILLLGFFTWYFLNTTKALDEPAIVTLQTNAGKIKAMQTVLEKVEKAVSERAGGQ